MNIKVNHLYECEIGLEKESLRLNRNGRFAQTPHPFLGEAGIDRDFCENQIELITAPSGSAKGAYEEILRLHRYVVKALASRNEYLWLFSNPPYFEDEAEIPVAHFTGSLQQKEQYRLYLAEKYGKRKMLYSGIHYNFSFSERLLNRLYTESGCGNYRTFTDTLYLSLAKKAVSYSWLIVYLTAASPVFDSSFFENETDKRLYLNRYASARCSEIGYRNDFLPILDYTSLEGYTGSIEQYVNEGKLLNASELYYPVRLKPKGANSLTALREQGINHIELRTLDLNPLSPAGIFEEDIAFLHMLLLYLLFSKDFAFTEELQKRAIEKMYRAALFNDSAIREEARSVLEDIKRFFADKPFPPYEGVIDYQIEKITQNKRYAVLIKNKYQTDFTNKGFALSKKAAEQ